MEAKTELTETLCKMFPTQEAKLKEILQKYNITREHDCRGSLLNRIDHFITAKQIDGLSPKTLKEYGYILHLFAGRVHKQVTKITADDVRDYIRYLLNIKKLRESSVQTHINTLRSFFTWLDIEDVIKKNPMRKIRSSKIDRKKTRNPLAAEEIERLREACKTYKEKALLEFLLSTGCRLSEIVGIQVQQINWQERSLTVLGKGNKTRQVYFSVRAKMMLEAYLQGRKGGVALFSSTRFPYAPLQSRAIQRILQLIGERLPQSRRVHPHLMRHTFATNALNGGMDITVIQRLLGHTDPKTTLIYAELSPKTVQFEYEKVIA